MTFSSCVSIPACLPDETDAAIDERVTFPSPAFVDILSMRSASARSFALSRATSRSSTTSNSSPARGTLFRPITWTALDGPALSTSFPRSSYIARIFPKASPHTIISALLRVPFCTTRVARGPLPLSRQASIAVPFAFLSGLAFKSCNSATSMTVSNSSSTLSPVRALI
uniref:Mitochondrial translational initiation factor, putative n=1 Tax=Arundo donax TaxID=35708 RepID=A0A0A9QUA1_ARUDO